MTVLVDHNVEGQAALLWSTLVAEGVPELFPAEFVTFSQVGLPCESSDRAVWRFAQENGLVLLTGNRRMVGADSLELTIREDNTVDSLPVLTISNVNRIFRKAYRERCAVRLLEILMDLDNYRGIGRLFIP